jgi:hypothetical protein
MSRIGTCLVMTLLGEKGYRIFANLGISPFVFSGEGWANPEITVSIWRP